jgi:glutathione S-transferase
MLPNRGTFEQKQQAILNQFARIEGSVMGKPYFAGEPFSLIDAEHGPIFRYFDVLELVINCDFFAQTPNVKGWRQALQQRPSVRNAVAEDYPQRLWVFFQQRNSYLATRMLVPQG